MSESLIRKSVERISGYTPGEQPAGREFVKLNTNENPYPPSPAVEEALASFAARDLRLYPDPVNRKLRERIAQIHGCRPDQVFAGNGSDEILALCTRAFVEDDGAIGFLDVSYSLYPVLADIRNVRKLVYRVTDEFDWPPELAAVTKKKGTAPWNLFFLANPNAPTGILFPKERVRSLCSAGHGVVLIDEAYVDFASESCMDLALEYGNTLVMRTLSKSYSLAGLRVGYAVGPEWLVGALMKIKDSYNLDRLSQTLALAALNDLPHMQANVARIQTTRAALSERLRRMGCLVYPSETNFLWVRPAGIAADDLYRRLKERGILIRYFPGERTGAFVRITIGTEDEVCALVRNLQEILDEPARG